MFPILCRNLPNFCMSAPACVREQLHDHVGTLKPRELLLLAQVEISPLAPPLPCQAGGWAWVAVRSLGSRNRSEVKTASAVGQLQVSLKVSCSKSHSMIPVMLLLVVLGGYHAFSISVTRVS